MIFFGKPADTGWARLRDVYGALGSRRWDWRAVSANPGAFKQWLHANWRNIRGKFGNHRKYASIDPAAKIDAGSAIESYILWAMSFGGQISCFSSIVRKAGNDPTTIFDAFYESLPVKGFGRLGRFDWVAMLSRYGLIGAIPGKAYLQGATEAVAQ